MARLIIKKDLLDRDIEEYTIPTGVNVARWLMDNIPEPEVCAKLFLNSVSEKTELHAEDMDDFTSAPDDILILVNFPGWPAVPYILAIFAIVLAVVLRPSLPIPNEFEDDSRSPNNEISGQKNRLRPGARIPDILGTVRSWPDLLTPSYGVWSGDIQVLTQYFCLGIGEYDITKAKLGDTFIDTIPTSHVVFYSLERSAQRPDKVLSVLSSAQIDNVPLLDAAAVSSLEVPITFNTSTNRITVNSGAVPPLQIGNYFSVKDGGSATTKNPGIYKVDTVVSSTVPYIYTIATPNSIGTTQSERLLAYEAQAVSLQTWVTISAVGRPIPFGGNAPNSLSMLGAEYEKLGWPRADTNIDKLIHIDALLDGEIAMAPLFPSIPAGYVLKYSAGGSFVYPTLSTFVFTDLNNDPQLDWVASPVNFNTGKLLITVFRGVFDSNWQEATSPSVLPDEIWVDIRFPQGLFIQRASEAKSNWSVQYEITIQALSDSDDTQTTGAQFSQTFTKDFKSVDPVQFTERFKTADIKGIIPAFTIQNKYLVRVRRVGNQVPSDATKTIQEDMVWASLRGVRYILANDFGDVTTSLVTMTSSTLLNELEDTTFNVVAQRKLPDYTVNSGLGVKRPTNKWADGFLYRMLADDGGQFSFEEVDTQGVFAIQSALDLLDGGKAGEMSLTLDRYQNVNKEISILAGVIRGLAYRLGERLFVVRDQKQLSEAVSLYNRRNKAPKAEVLSLEFLGKSGVDGIEYEFFDSANDFKTIKFVYPTTSAKRNLKRMKGVGISHWAQAWRRAYYEWEVIQRRIDNLTIEIVEDPRVLSPLDKIKNVDNLDSRGRTDGEVIGIDYSSKEIFLDKDVEFLPSETYTIWIRKTEIDGNEAVDSSQVTAGSAPNSVIYTNIGGPTFLIEERQANNNDTVGTLYSFAADSSDLAQDFLIMGYDLTSDGFTSVSCVKYDENVYTGDTAVLPAPPTPPA